MGDMPQYKRGSAWFQSRELKVPDNHATLFKICVQRRSRRSLRLWTTRNRPGYHLCDARVIESMALKWGLPLLDS
jgi:hypothetical protein